MSETTDKTAKTVAAKTPGGQDAATAKIDDNADTPTQLTETAPKPMDEVEPGKDPKIVRTDVPPGSGTSAAQTTTVVEEVRILDPKTISTDRDEQIATMKVLAHSQGINQSIVLGSKKNDKGEAGTEVLIVFQDGSHTVDFVPEIPESVK